MDELLRERAGEHGEHMRQKKLLARELNLSVSQLYRMIAGDAPWDRKRAEGEAAHIVTAAKFLGVSEEELQPPPRNDTAPAGHEAPAGAGEGLTEYARGILHAAHRMSSTVTELIEEVMGDAAVELPARLRRLSPTQQRALLRYLDWQAAREAGLLSGDDAEAEGSSHSRPPEGPDEPHQASG